MTKILFKFGQQQLVMVNYARDFNQTEMGKYFEWIIINSIIITIFISKPERTAALVSHYGGKKCYKMSLINSLPESWEMRWPQGVSALGSRGNSPGSGQGHWKLYSHRAYLHPCLRCNKWVPANLVMGGNPAID